MNDSAGAVVVVVVVDVVVVVVVVVVAVAADVELAGAGAGAGGIVVDVAPVVAVVAAVVGAVVGVELHALGWVRTPTCNALKYVVAGNAAYAGSCAWSEKYTSPPWRDFDRAIIAARSADVVE